MEVREGYLRAGFRAIAPRFDTFEKALARLSTDGHLGQRKCLIVKGRKGFSALVYKGGKTRRLPQGHSVGARVTKDLGPKTPAHAWLEVPEGCVARAIELCS